MGSLIYVRLIGLTFGTLVQLFWMVVILGYRRQRNFERVFFFLCLALFLFYGGSLLALNAQIHYDETPVGLQGFAIAVITTGLCLLPALLLHMHMEFAETRGLLKNKRWKSAVALLFYAASLHLVLHSIPIQITRGHFDFVLPGNSLGDGFAWLFSVALLWSSTWEFRFYRNAPEAAQRAFHSFLTCVFLLACLGIVDLHVLPISISVSTREALGVGLSLIPVFPLVALTYLVMRHNFLQIGRQKNLVYAVSATFLALLYLSLVRRVSGWLEPELPPEASASILLFVLVIFIEPLQRMLGRTLQETAQREMDRVQRLTAEIQQEARQGDLEALAKFVERRVKEMFELATATVTLAEEPRLQEGKSNSAADKSRFALVESSESEDVLARKASGVLRAVPHGALLSGETRAALEFLCEQLPGAFDLCRLIEEKLRLERELAERERLALVGQMAASISHNLKNPLGSIKTILQVQLESSELPETIRSETKIVLDEIGRLSAKLNQLLQFSRPAVRSSGARATCDARVVIEEVVGVLRHEAERRGIVLETCTPDNQTTVAAASDAVSDVVSNLLVNALEATPRGGRVSVSALENGDGCVLTVEDDGPGIAPGVREKILQPFFTTKTQGTGLGLAIVARRVAEFRGQLEVESPVQDGRGARFRVKFGGDEVRK
jgi:nitrogen-specific signal transduction histidine kinase/Na+-transporting NADH:ubiquinone oxidoreductase subunit NqrE